MSSLSLIIVIGFVAFQLLVFSFAYTRYKRCPPDKVMVISGKTHTGKPIFIKQGTFFVWPMIQSYAYLDLKPFSFELDLHNILEKIELPWGNKARCTARVSPNESDLENALPLVGFTQKELGDFCADLVKGALQTAASSFGSIDVESKSALNAKITAIASEKLAKVGVELQSVIIL